MGEHGSGRDGGGPQDCAQREYLMGGSFREEERRVGGQKPGPEPSVLAESLRILACLLVKAFEQEKRGDLRCWGRWPGTLGTVEMYTGKGTLGKVQRWSDHWTWSLREQPNGYLMLSLSQLCARR